MDKVFLRNYALFFLILFFCASGLIYILISGNRKIDKIDSQVKHTQDVITEAQHLSTLIEGILASQRGYIITRQKNFMEEYEVKRNDFSETIARLSDLIHDNPSQVARTDDLKRFFNNFSNKLEERAGRFSLVEPPSADILEDTSEIDEYKENIIRINDAILLEEYSLLNNHVRAVSDQRSRYFTTLLIGVVAASAMLFLFNGFLLNAQKKRSSIEASLRDTQERFSLAIEGTQDGIFDWDLVTGKVFYSKQFFGMLGYERDAFFGTDAEFKDVLHPDDAEKTWKHVDEYLSGGLPDYSQEFRLRHKNGSWIWVQTRAKAIRNKFGKPVRMVGAHTDISHLKERETQLESERNEAEAANMAKSDFLAHMSHEIRTPLTAISGIAEIFEKNQTNLNDKQKRLIQTLHSSTSALKDLINDILDFSKIESGELELSREAFPISSLFEEVTSMMALRANEKKISFICDYQDVKDIDFHGDKLRLRQILINLVGNAIKFTSEGSVNVKATADKEDEQAMLRIDVADTGIGIAPEHFNLIFERFKQADASVSRKYGGTGLGLPISKNLANLMGGTIILNSQPGKGSVFSLFVPCNFPDVKVEHEKPVPDSDSSISLPKVPGKKILMVEDYEGNIVVLSHLLEEMGLAHDIARTGAEAIKNWNKNEYDIILMDIQMPEMDGFAATRLIRAMEKEKNLLRTPIIGMTAHALVGDKDKCIAAGMDSYLPKPIVESHLQRKILQYLKEGKKAA